MRAFRYHDVPHLSVGGKSKSFLSFVLRGSRWMANFHPFIFHTKNGFSTSMALVNCVNKNCTPSYNRLL